jgi:large subunit ribosomal protein L4
MIQLPLYDKQGERVSTVEIDPALFGGKIQRALLHDVIVNYEANRRVGTHSTKTRGEVEGSTRKPWKQKHTGRARAGTVRSPLWRHGGVIFGPRPRDYSYEMPRKMKRAALDSALLGKFQDNEALVIEGLDAPEKPSTKTFARLFDKMGLERTALVGIKAPDARLHLSLRNLPRVRLAPVGDLNAYDVLKHKHLVLTREALETLVAKRKEKNA